MSYTLLGNVINDDDITANLANYAYLGWDCSINDAGDKMVVAAMEQNNGNLGRGNIFAFQYSGGSWSSYGDELRGPADSVGSANQCMTHSVKMNGDGTIFISGHPLHDRGTTQSQRNDREGAVMIKQYNSETDTWDARGPAILTTLPLLENSDGNDFTVDRFGEMVGISGDGSIIVIGARYSDYGGNNRGAVLTYKYKIPSGDEWSAGTNLVFKDGDSSQVGDKYYWVLIGNASTNASSGGQTAGNGISLVGESNNDLLGSSVSISYGGTRIAVGIMGEDDGGTDRGMIRIFDYNSGTDKWEQVGQDIKGDNNNDTIGYLLEESHFAQHYIDATKHKKHPLVIKLVARDYSKEVEHVAFSTNTEADSFMDVFIDLMILGLGKCVAHGVGGYGRLGAALSGGECVMAHRTHLGRPNMCSDVLAKIKV